MESVGCYGAKPKNYRDRYGDLRDSIRENAVLLNDLYHFEQTMLPHIANLREDRQKLENRQKELEDDIAEYETKIKQEENRLHENQREKDFSEIKQQIREKENEFEQLMLRRCELLAKAEEM